MIQKTAFITGGANGIGLAIAETFANEGYALALCDLSMDKLEVEVAHFHSKGYQVLGFVCDVTDEVQLAKVFAETLAHFGRIDVLINNAGLQYICPVESFPVAQFEHLMKVMLVGSFIAIKHVFPIMKQQEFGRIINMASINGLVGFAGKAAYNSAKHGLIGLTKVTALEGAAYGITVNALCPGYVGTALLLNQLNDLSQIRKVGVEQVLDEVIYPLVPIKRLLDVGEIARYALFLASEQSGGITGQAVVIDGGYLAQ